MDPEDISGQLDLSPSRKWKAGSQRSTPAGEQLAGTNKETYCVFDLDEKVGSDLELTLCALTTKFRNFEKFFKKVRSTGGTIEFFVGLFVKVNTGIVLDRGLMAQLTKLGIDLSFDIYESHRPRKVAARQVAR